MASIDMVYKHRIEYCTDTRSKSAYQKYNVAKLTGLRGQFFIKVSCMSWRLAYMNFGTENETTEFKELK